MDGALLRFMNDLQIEGLFQIWNAALATSDPEVVTALYSADAILLPTRSNMVCSYTLDRYLTARSHRR
jgi:hypothetical protein